MGQDGSMTTEPTEPGAPADPMPGPGAPPPAPNPQGAPSVTQRLPPDPAAYDSPRAQHARARGLSAPYIPGGRDPDPDAGLAEERRYLRLLVAMVIVVILSGFVLGIVANLLGLTNLLGS
jgi:hypothetical protein